MTVNADIKKIRATRESLVKIVKMLSLKSVKVTQQGVGAFVQTKKDGTPVRVNLPSLPDNASIELVRAVQGFLDHECAHILFSDFKALNNNSITNGKRSQSMANIVEDTWIERRMAKEFKGSNHNLNNTRTFFCEEMIEQKARSAHDAKTKATMLMVPYFRALAGHTICEDWLKDNDFWSDMKLVQDMLGDEQEWRDKFMAVENTAQAIELADEILSLLVSVEPPNPTEGEGGEEGGEPDEKDADGKGQSENKGKSKDKEEKDNDKSDTPDDPNGDSDNADDSSDQGDAKSGEEQDSEGGDDSSTGDDSDADSDSDGDGNGDADGEDVSDGDSDSSSPDDNSSGGDDNSGDDSGGDDESEGNSDGNSGDDSDGDTSSGTNPSSSSPDEDSSGAEIDPDIKDKVKKDISLGGDLSCPVDLENIPDFDQEVADKLADIVARMASTSSYTPFSRDYDKAVPLEYGEYDAPVDDLDNASRKISGIMQKDLQRLIAARSHSLKVPGHRSGRLHGASLHRITSGDDRVFTRLQVNTSKDVAVTLLIDCSGSMHGRESKVAFESAYAFATTLSRIGVPFEVLGFTTGDHTRSERAEIKASTDKFDCDSYNRFTPIHMPIFKGYNEQFTTIPKQRMAAAWHRFQLTGSSGNIDGDSVRMAAARLAPRSETRKVMFVFSDGMPAGGWDDDRKALYIDLKNAVQECEALGIETIGFGIMTDGPKSFYPKYAIINTLDDLPGVVMKELKSILL